jgi:hypothetical protein
LPSRYGGCAWCVLDCTLIYNGLLQRSEEFPYTHPFGEVRSFSIAVLDGVTFVITAGGEGLIRTWRFDAAKGAFEQIMVLEGHLRAVTSVLLNGKCFSHAAAILVFNVYRIVRMSQVAFCGRALWTPQFACGTSPAGSAPQHCRPSGVRGVTRMPCAASSLCRTQAPSRLSRRVARTKR